jgi:hypothetical protein
VVPIALELRSEGRQFGDPGFYFTVWRDADSVWVKYVRAMTEWLHVYVGEGEELRADHPDHELALRILILAGFLSAPEEDEEKEEEADEPDTELVEVTQKAVTEVKKSEPGERTDDPVRMYLREMGTVELLSREGEIAIAKRIEAGREAMIAGLCESPLTFQAIIIWRDELNEGKVFLRDIIDLEATYAGPDAKAMPTAMMMF